jgi:hypothetical protein
LSEKRGFFTSSWCIPFSRSKPSCRLCFAQRPRFTFALRAVGRVSFSSRRHARLPSPEFTHSPSAVHGCAGRAPHAAVHGHGHARVFMEAYDVREPFICYDDGVCSRATNPMDPFASADCLTASCRIVCRSAVLQGAETGYDGDRLRRRARGPHSIRGQRPRICACAAPFPPPPRIDCDFGLSLAYAIASDGEAFAFRAWQQARVSMLGGCRVVEGCCGVAADAQKACWGVAVDARGSKRDALACARRAARGCCVAPFQGVYSPYMPWSGILSTPLEHGTLGTHRSSGSSGSSSSSGGGGASAAPPHSPRAAH